jgi:ankyrin repeat protein
MESKLSWKLPRNKVTLALPVIHFIGNLEKVVNAPAKRGVTPLHYACSLGYKNIIELLVKSGNALGNKFRNQ